VVEGRRWEGVNNSQISTRVALRCLINTSTNVTLLELFTKHYLVKVQKNTLLFVHHDIKRMGFEFVLPIAARFSSCVSVIKRPCSHYEKLILNNKIVLRFCRLSVSQYTKQT